MTDWLLGTLLATSALTLFVLLVREPVRRRFGSRVAYGLWLIPAARLFMPTLTHSVERTVPASTPLRPLTDPLVRESLWMAQVRPADPSLVDQLGGWPDILFALWLAVAAALFLSRVIAYRRDRRAILDRSQEVERIGSVRIVRSPEVVSPIALGIFDRLIAVPLEFERLYGPRQRRLVLEHELAHHRSGDLVANLFAFVLLCLQWFNPLAWLAHAAFRFDQEAACDARVLGKVTGEDRAEYGRAIAKAASGRALLFASALDRRNTLQRRLQSMLRNPNSHRRVVGRLLVITAIAAALPLTATRAVHYVDVPSAQRPVAVPRATPAVAPLASAAVVAAQPVRAVEPARLVHASAAAVADPAPVVHVDDRDNFTISGDLVTIDGVTKRWEDLTPVEKARVRSEVAKASEALARTHIDQARIAQDLARIPNPAQMAGIQRQLAGTRASLASSVRRMDEQADRDRAAGRNPDQLETAIRVTLRSAQAIDFGAVSRALANVDRVKIATSVANAQASMDAGKAELARMQARIDADRPR
jgi:bla regulator protein blaR1